MASNIVEILVKSVNDTKAGFDAAKADAETAGDEAGQSFMYRFGQKLGGTEGLAGTIAKNIGLQEISGLVAGVAVAAPAIAALLVEIVGVVNGFVAATLGIGALGLVALPTFEKISNAYTAINTAQAAYNTAAEKQKLDPTKANAAAVATALLNLKVAQQQAGPAATAAINGIDGLKKAFGQMAASFQPQILGILNQGLGIAAQLLPVVAQFAQAAAPAVSQVMGALSKAIDSKGFKTFVDEMVKISPGAIEAIGGGLIKVAGAFGHLATVMSAHDVAHALNILFDVLAGSINLFATWVSGAMKNWDNFSSHMQQIAHTVTGNWQAMLNWFKGLPASFDQLIRNIENYWDDFTSFVKGLVSTVEHAFDGLPGFLRSAGEAAITGLIHGLESVPVLGVALRIGGQIISGLKGVLGIHSPSTVLMEMGRNAVQGFQIGLGQAAGGSVATVKGIGGAGGSGGMTLNLGGPPQSQALLRYLWPALMLEVRNRGGGGPNSVQRALGQVS